MLIEALEPGRTLPGKGKLHLTFVGDDGKKIEREVFQFPAAGSLAPAFPAPPVAA